MGGSVTVAELIVKLQEMPQDLPVYRADMTWKYVSVDEVFVDTVNDERATYATREDEWKNPVRIEAVMVQ